MVQKNLTEQLEQIDTFIHHIEASTSGPTNTLENLHVQLRSTQEQLTQVQAQINELLLFESSNPDEELEVPDPSKLH